MKNKPMMYDGHRVIPVTGIQRIIQGVRYELENIVTHEKQWFGDGTIIYDNSYEKNNPIFALKLLTNENESEV